MFYNQHLCGCATIAHPPRWDYDPGKLWCCSGFIVRSQPVSATPLSIALFSTSIVQDFYDIPDDEEDTGSSHEYLNDLEEEYQARALLANSKRFFKKGPQRFSSAKAIDQAECHICGKKGHFARVCWSKTSLPSYKLPCKPKPPSSSQYKPELRLTKDFKSKYNKVKAKLALLSSSASASKSLMVKNKGLIVKAYEWDEEVSSDDNEMVEVKVLMALAEDNDVISKESARNGECVKISMRKVHTHLEMKDNDDELSRIFVFLEIMLKNKEIIVCVERPWLSEAEGFILPNQNTSRILPLESQRNIIDPSDTVTDSSATDYDSVDESLVCSTPLPPLKKLNAPTRGNKSTLASKVNSAPAARISHLTLEITIINRIIYLRRGIKPRNPQHVMKSCETYGSTVHTTTDHNDIEWFRRGEALLRLNHQMLAVLRLPLKGPKVVFEDDSTCTTVGYGSIKCNGNLGAGMLTRAMARELSAASAHECLFVDFFFEDESKKVSKPLNHPGWVDAMQDEVNQFSRNKVWTLVPTPYGKTIIGSKWVFRNKRDENGIVIKNKARLVAQGYNQQEGMYYDETFAHTRGDDAVELTDEEFIDPDDENLIDKDEVAEIFRIETNIFDFETPICKAFDEFNYLLKINTDLLTSDVLVFKTYDEFKNEWMDEWNKGIPWVLEEPWSKNGIPIDDIHHIYEPFCFKNENAIWPTCNSNDEGFCNGKELLRMVRVGYMTYFQDNKWYDDLGDGKLKEEALKQKAIYERSWGDDSRTITRKEIMRRPLKRKRSQNDDHDIGNIDYDLVRDNSFYHTNEEEEQDNKDRCELLGNPHQEPSVCEIRRFEMIKYSLEPTEKYITIKEYEYADLTRTKIKRCNDYLSRGGISFLRLRRYFFLKPRHRYTVSSLMDTTYWVSEQ
nr:retrovirus-related Pol polyprotein from transposon TNT 1-94 [Tanacetum cinerariifolium]